MLFIRICIDERLVYIFQIILDLTKALSERLGKTAVTVNEYPGFVVNRILIPMLNEAVFMLQEGVASARLLIRL